jgi:hypothetical protein
MLIGPLMMLVVVPAVQYLFLRRSGEPNGQIPHEQTEG